MNIFKLAFLYVGLVIGAGFASGREVLTYFVSYEKFGIVGIIFAGILFCITGVKSLLIALEKDINSYGDFLKKGFKNLAPFLEIVTGLFLMAVYSAMISSFGAVFFESFGIKSVYGALLGSLLCGLVFVFGKDGILVINSILTPFIVVFLIFIIFVYGIKNISVFQSFGKGSLFLNTYLYNFNLFLKAMLSAFVYVSYNCVTAVSVLISMKEVVKNKFCAIVSGTLGGVLLLIIGFLMTNMLMGDSTLLNYDLPFLYTIKDESQIVLIMYKIALIFAIITTALGNGYASMLWLSENIFKNIRLSMIFVVVFGFLTSFIGFSSFVSKVYFVFGILGGVLVLGLILYKTSK